jgi:hypothetical protein
LKQAQVGLAAMQPTIVKLLLKIKSAWKMLGCGFGGLTQSISSIFKYCAGAV